MGDGFLRLIRGDGSTRLLGTHLTCPDCGKSYAAPEPSTFSFNSPHGWCTHCQGHGRISNIRLKDEDKESRLEHELRYDREVEKAAAKEDSSTPCPHCNGHRLNPFALAVTLFDRNIASIGLWSCH